MMLAYASIPHQCVDIPMKEWPAKKEAGDICHFGQLPSLKLADGTLISQSGSITRYVAKIAKLYPEDPVAAAEADMIFELSQEMGGINPILNYFPVGQPLWKDKYEEYFASLPRWMGAAEKLLGDKDFFGGPAPHYGDFGLFHICDNTLTVDPRSLDSYPAIIAWVDRMKAFPAIQKYMAERPGPSTPNWGIPGTLMMSKKS